MMVISYGIARCTLQRLDISVIYFRSQKVYSWVEQRIYYMRNRWHRDIEITSNVQAQSQASIDTTNKMVDNTT